MICCNAMLVAFEDIPQMVIVLFTGLLKQFNPLGYLSLIISGISLLFKITMCAFCRAFINNDKNYPSRKSQKRKNGNSSAVELEAHINGNVRKHQVQYSRSQNEGIYYQ